MMLSRESRSSSYSDRNSIGSNQGSSPSPPYLLEHLATFTVSPSNDLIYPSDGMRRLLAMEKTNGIWTQKMLMRIRNKTVNITDYENKETVEQFPIGLVSEPTAFTSNDPKEMYNNILIFIVSHPRGDIPPEMHIFQCVNILAKDIVKDFKELKSDKGNRNQISPDEIGRNNSRQRRIQAQLVQENNNKSFEETSSTSSEKYEKEVSILNRCFDDIEKFISRLQNSAAAYRELEKRRRKNSKFKDHGEGMLAMRAKPPPKPDFVDIFQKFKLSFNLLARLRSHIHDPNAPELIHFLFTPLALIVDASHDSQYGLDLSSKVVSPLLTKKAVDLLINCLTSKESELWHSLGESWYIPKEKWEGFVSPYTPVFIDGSSPKELEQAYPSDSSDPDHPSGHSELESLQKSFLMDLLAQECPVVQVTYPRTGNNDKELTVMRGEFLAVLDDSRKWWRVRNVQGRVGHVPHTILTGVGAEVISGGRRID